MAKYQYRCNTECVRTDFEDILGYPGGKRVPEGTIVDSHRKIDSPKFDLLRYEPDPPEEESRSAEGKADRVVAKTDKE